MSLNWVIVLRKWQYLVIMYGWHCSNHWLLLMPRLVSIFISFLYPLPSTHSSTQSPLLNPLYPLYPLHSPLPTLLYTPLFLIFILPYVYLFLCLLPFLLHAMCRHFKELKSLMHTVTGYSVYVLYQTPIRFEKTKHFFCCPFFI